MTHWEKFGESHIYLFVRARVISLSQEPLWRKLTLLTLVAWQVLYFGCPYIPDSVKPPIDVRTLVIYDTWLLHYLPGEILSSLICLPLDVLQAIPYTIHISWPFIFAAFLFYRKTDLVLPFLGCWGTVCLLGVITQLVFPTAPPWYYAKYGFAPASYSLMGDPGGLERVDAYFNITFYKNMFDASPLVFGSFPSLHVAWPALICTFIRLPSLGVPLAGKLAAHFYLFWVCFAVLYLDHHFIMDVLGGMLYSFVVFKLLGPEALPFVFEVETEPSLV